MKSIELDYSNAKNFISDEDIKNLLPLLKNAHDNLHTGNGLGSDYLGWMDYPINYDKDEFEIIKKSAKKIQNDSDVLIVIGIGGSYLGTRAAIDMLGHNFRNNIDKKERRTPEIYYAGNNISSSYILDLFDVIGDRDYSINIISKSGTTTEPAIAFRIFKDHLEKKYGKEEASKRIYATTDAKKGALKQLSDKKGYEQFVIRDDIGGRYSVITPVGLLPIAVAGFNIDMIMEGNKDAREEYMNEDVYKNDAYMYALCRMILEQKGKDIELLVNYEPQLQTFSEWWKQLFAESHGKNQKGIYPSSLNYSTDLHSVGQYIQDGKRIMFETVLNVKKPRKDLKIILDEENLDKLNYMANKSVDYVNHKALEGAMLAHTDGQVPNLMINIERLDEYNFGKLIYFFEKACAINGYMMDINPFDQPGVEDYKTNMFALLGKPGYEDKSDELKERIKGI
ncbi:glucose-6-phosphate isomerase [Peptostreptococcus equinus]|uniref:Glucose-6-phosphate isomerase n=1 Tax=Peptostreptococcus equinus TaxID=3003601 RepID=A0ABY7JS43_9FIRM|nr:glucose-6-phosphate isomerase [Peptostreptococcus sp. CBA3647]WAW15316.1 glucose-6-phosphate isomerase [Peptostreptococcus sp. CBA3647]